MPVRPSLLALLFFGSPVSAQVLYTYENWTNWVPYSICSNDHVTLICNVGNTNQNSNICNASQYNEFWSWNLTYGSIPLHLNHTVNLNGCIAPSGGECQISCDPACICYRQSDGGPCGCAGGTYPPSTSRPTAMPTLSAPPSSAPSTASPTLLPTSSVTRPTGRPSIPPAQLPGGTLWPTISHSPSSSPTTTPHPTPTAQGALANLPGGTEYPTITMRPTRTMRPTITRNPAVVAATGGGTNSPTVIPTINPATAPTMTPTQNPATLKSPTRNPSSSANSTTPTRPKYPFSPFRTRTTFYTDNAAMVTCPSGASCGYVPHMFTSAAMMGGISATGDSSGQSAQREAGHIPFVARNVLTLGGCTPKPNATYCLFTCSNVCVCELPPGKENCTLTGIQQKNNASNPQNPNAGVTSGAATCSIRNLLYIGLVGYVLLPLLAM